MESTKKHVVIVPFPAQGHVNPAIRLANLLADFGLKITLFTTDSIGSRLSKESKNYSNIVIFSFPDGLAKDETNRHAGRIIMENFVKLMPAYLTDFINRVQRQEETIDCIISDNIWALKTAKMMGLKTASFVPVGSAALALGLRSSELLQAGIVDDEGTPLKKEEFLLSPHLPALTNTDYMWNFPGDKLFQKFWFQLFISVEKYLKESNWVLGNWFHDLDPSADDLLPNVIPVGPLLSSNNSSGSFFSQDSSCLTWLDKHPLQSVIYIAFGSTTKFNQQQFEELAIGLELIGKPFLWVVRPDFTNWMTTEYFDNLQKRVGNIGKLVEWAPQEKVLSHPSISFFLTHCGYNSVLESISLGVPMLCWPYYADHFYYRSCVCNSWKAGLELNPNENGIVTRHQLKTKVDQLLANNGIRSNVLKLKKLAQKSIGINGSSYQNLAKFVEQLSD
ncbi:hypothetical protein JCGZ_11704 [Jatropha curcas]|uniref:Glycosyltransferase n=1 Tax=Jatropha curcas TaxID=180498 RepID=A0A067K8J7_JATCU|nr:UDP-glycosyltransferase 83A1 [Jatropha curcas]KDP31328.1 hypothetical protein JCGZ_11704 [Jatropha curcas]